MVVSGVDSELLSLLDPEVPFPRTALLSSASKSLSSKALLDSCSQLSSRCQGENHLARDCLAPRDEAAILASKKCYKCQETGHIARDCTKETEELSADIDE